jgi:hypothetical protein
LLVVVLVDTVLAVVAVLVVTEHLPVHLAAVHLPKQN